MPVSISFERLPNAAPGASGGLPTVDASNHSAGVQGTLNVNASQISGDAIAADNLEAMLDGTGGVLLKLKQLDITQTTPTENAVNITANAAASAGIVINANDSMGTGIILNTGIGTIDLDGTDLKTLLNTTNTNVLNNKTVLDIIDNNTDTVEGSLSTIDTEVGNIQTSLNTIAGTTFNASTDSLEAIRDRGDAAWISGGGGATAAEVRTEIDANSTQLAAIKAKTDQITNPAGDGDTVVNHDTSGSDNLRATSGGGNGLDNVTIRAYLKSEYDADAAGATLRGTAVTAADGRWVTPMMLNSGLTYTLVYSRTDLNTLTKEVTVP